MWIQIAVVEMPYELPEIFIDNIFLKVINMKCKAASSCPEKWVGFVKGDGPVIPKFRDETHRKCNMKMFKEDYFHLKILNFRNLK